MKISSSLRSHAEKLDEKIKRYPNTENGNRELLVNMIDFMLDFKAVMDMGTPVELDYLCQQYSNLGRFGKILSNMAQGLADGSLK